MEALAVETAPTYSRKVLIGIYEQHSTALYRYAYRLLGDQHLAEDCVSETFSRFLRAVRDGRGPTENIRAYLYRVAHNLATDHYRRRAHIEIPLDVELGGDVEGNPVHQFAQDQERERVRAALYSLPIDQRRVIELRFLEGWRHDEVAEALGKTAEATRALQHRALVGLKRLLSEDASSDFNKKGQVPDGSEKFPA